VPKSCRLHQNMPNRPLDSPLPNLPIRQLMVSSPLVVAIGIARSARGQRRASGSPSARPSCCRFRIFTSSTRCRASCAVWPIKTSASSTTC
jgi:hypothetical protein